MDNKFKTNMFITSFLPLWFSIIFMNVWDIGTHIIENWNNNITFSVNIKSAVESNWLGIVVVLLAFITPIYSMTSIAKFIKEKAKTPNKPRAKVVKAKRANKLTSEFLLAYILPMIAFDFTDPRDLILFTVYFIVLARLCISNNNIYTNIFLEIKKYKLYECDIERCVMNKTKTYENTLVISQLDVTEQTNRDVEFADFENYIYLNLKGV